MTHRHPVRAHPGRVQQSERRARLSHQQGFHARRRGEAAGHDRRRHLRAPGARDAGQQARHPGDARQRRHADQGRRPGRAEGVRLQERRADERSVDRAERRQGIRPAPSRFPSDEAVDVRVDRDAEQDVHLPDGGRPDQSGNRVSRRNARPSRTTSARARPRARCTCIRTAGFSTARTAPRQTVDFQGKKVFKGGENSIVVYAIDQSTGEPTPIQHIETQKIHPRTFHIDPSGRLLVAQHNLPVDVREGDTVKTRRRPGCRCSASATTASSRSCAPTTSTSATSHVLDGHGAAVARARRAGKQADGMWSICRPLCHLFLHFVFHHRTVFLHFVFLRSCRLSSFHLSSSVRLYFISCIMLFSSSCRPRHRRPSSKQRYNRQKPSSIAFS